MKKFYVFLLISSFLATGVGKAQYSSTLSGGYFTDAGTWTGGIAPGKIVDQELYINGYVTFDDDITLNGIGLNGNSAVNDGGYLAIQNGKTLILSTRDFYVKSGGTLEITGDFMDDLNDVFVEEGGTLIVHGSMTLSSYGSQLAGNVVVLGDVELKDIELAASCNLVVGGLSFKINPGVDNYVGSIYLLDPDVISDIHVSINAVTGNISDLYVDIESFGEPIDGLLGDHIDGLAQDNSWQGEDTQWLNEANWSGATPGALDNVIISSSMSNYPILSGDVTIASLTVESGALLTVAAGSSVTILSDATIDGDLIVKNTVSQPTSVIINGNVTGDASTQWSYPQSRFWYIAHAISNVSIANYEALGDSYFLYEFVNNAWNNITGTGDGFSEPLKGYAFNGSDADAEVSHHGSLNVLDYTGVNARTLSNGWHLMANPYAAYLDLLRSAHWEFGGARLTIYTKTTIGAERVNSTYNIVENVGTNGGTRYIAPGQSFWVYHYGSHDFGVARGARTHATGMLKSSVVEPNDILRLTLANQHTTDEIAVLFRSSGSGSRGQSDSEKRLESNDRIPYLYSIKEDERLAINTLPELGEALSVPLGYQVGAAGAGEMILSVVNMYQFLPDISVYLEDLATGEWIDLRLHSQYAFDTSAMANNERFVLHFVDAVSTGIGEIDGEELDAEKEGIHIFTLANIVKVKVEDVEYTESVNIAIYSMLGEQIVNKTFNGNAIEIPLSVASGHYIVKVTAHGYRKQVTKDTLVVVR